MYTCTYLLLSATSDVRYSSAMVMVIATITICATSNYIGTSLTGSTSRTLALWSMLTTIGKSQTTHLFMITSNMNSRPDSRLQNMYTRACPTAVISTAFSRWPRGINPDILEVYNAHWGHRSLWVPPSPPKCWEWHRVCHSCKFCHQDQEYEDMAQGRDLKRVDSTHYFPHW